MSDTSTVPPTPPRPQDTMAEYSIPLRRRIAIARIAGRDVPDPPPPLPAPIPRRGAVHPAHYHPHIGSRATIDLPGLLVGESWLGRFAIVPVLAMLVALVPVISPWLMLLYVQHVHREMRRRREHRDALALRLADWRRHARSRDRARKRFGAFRR